MQYIILRSYWPETEGRPLVLYERNKKSDVYSMNQSNESVSSKPSLEVAVNRKKNQQCYLLKGPYLSF